MDKILFLNAAMNYKLTGIEHASIRRFRLFKEIGLSPKIVTLNFSTDLERIMSFHNIGCEDFLNFYTFHQNFKFDFNYQINDLRFGLNQAEFTQVKNCISDYRVVLNNQYTMYIRCFKDSGRISYINYFDQNGRKIRREIYDYYGYKSKEIILMNGSAVQENYFNAKGHIYLTISFDNDLRHYCLRDNGLFYFFNSEVELYRHWLTTLITGHTIFFIDKNRIYNPIVGPIKHHNLKKVSIIHSTHTSNPNQLNNKKINYNYKYLLENTDQFDACVVSSKLQCEELLADFDVSFSTHIIPPSYIKDYRVKKEKVKNNQFRILSIGRISIEKRHQDMIMAMKIVVDSLPQARLEFFGMGNAELKKSLQEKVIAEGLEDIVFFKEYSNDIQYELYNADLTLVTSTVESFCIAILDSLEQGTPVISYDIKYGPSSIIENGVNGALVEDGNIMELAKEIISFYLKNRHNYTINTMNVMENYSLKKVEKLWIDLLYSIKSEFY